MTTISPTLAITTCRLVPSGPERLLLRASQRLEAFAVRRMQRRASASFSDDQHEEARQTQSALHGIGLLPR